MEAKETSMPKGKCVDPEKERARCEAISRARMENKRRLGYVNSPETRKRMAAAKAGRTLPLAHVRHMSEALRGRTPANFAACLAAAHVAPKPKGKANPMWKGDAIGYQGVHTWVRSRLGQPSKCTRCGTTKAKRYEWANRSRKYLRRIWDWERLCMSCHRKDGYARGEYVPWNKGRRLKSS